MERTNQKPVPAQGTRRRFKTSVPPSQYTRKRQGHDAISIVQRSSHQRSGTLRFMRALFGLSTYIQTYMFYFLPPEEDGGFGLIDQLLNNLQHVYPNKVEGIRQSLCVHDLIGTERTKAHAQHLKQALQSIFRAGKFELHKWHSNVPSLEQPMPQKLATKGKLTIPQGESQRYAKDQLGVKQGEMQLLGVHWHNPDQLPCSNYKCNKERSPRRNRKDLRSSRTSITHYPGGKNNIQRSV